MIKTRDKDDGSDVYYTNDMKYRISSLRINKNYSLFWFEIPVNADRFTLMERRHYEDSDHGHHFILVENERDHLTLNECMETLRFYNVNKTDKHCHNNFHGEKCSEIINEALIDFRDNYLDMMLFEINEEV